MQEALNSSFINRKTAMHSGTLYLIATPIGNKEDISLRALRILREVNVIAAEDTRHSKVLLQHYQITTPLISVHEFNEAQRTPLLLTRLQQGESIALISDAGTPLISDPGYLLVKAVRTAGIQVVPIPGACAAIVALCASGLPTDRFIFEGFFPHKKNERKSRLELLQQESSTLIFYEAPHRIAACVQDILTVLGATREIVLAKELTKTFETFFQGTAQAAYEWLQKDLYHQKGEFVVLIRGAIAPIQQGITAEALRVLKILTEDLPNTQAIELTAKITGEKKNTLKALCFRK
jgi:16S rRNA (cytidine1402-2'-O)-methyltransferase